MKRQEWDQSKFKFSEETFQQAAHIIFINENGIDRYGVPAKVTWNEYRWAMDYEAEFNGYEDETGSQHWITDHLENMHEDAGV